jgi:phosphatidylinositol alpha 1,6-mannosyltransferase
VLEHLRATGHDAIVFCPTDTDVPASYAGYPVVPLSAVGLPFYADVRVGLTPGYQVEKLIVDYRPDVVHLAAPFAIGHSAVQASARHSIPSVAIYQTEIPSYASRYGWTPVQPLLWRRVKQIHELATLTLAPSTFAAEQLRSHGIPRVHLWKRGVDGVRFHPDRRDRSLRDELAPGGECSSAAWDGSPREAGRRPGGAGGPARARLVVIGAGPSRGELEKALPGAVFLGQLGGTDLPRALASLDVFVHTGELETFCQSIQEAEASGLPVVAPARGGPIDLVQPGVNGYLYRPGDLEEFRRHVASLVADPGLRSTPAPRPVREWPTAPGPTSATSCSTTTAPRCACSWAATSNSSEVDATASATPRRPRQWSARVSGLVAALMASGADRDRRRRAGPARVRPSSPTARGHSRSPPTQPRRIRRRPADLGRRRAC